MQRKLPCGSRGQGGYFRVRRQGGFLQVRGVRESLSFQYAVHGIRGQYVLLAVPAIQVAREVGLIYLYI